MIRRSVNNELERTRKEAVLSYVHYYTGIHTRHNDHEKLEVMKAGLRAKFRTRDHSNTKEPYRPVRNVQWQMNVPLRQKHT